MEVGTKQSEIVIRLTSEESEFLYYQLYGRKRYFEEDWIFWTTKENKKEAQRCSDAIENINLLLGKILNSQRI